MTDGDDGYLADRQFVLDAHRGSAPEPEHFARYGWAQRLVAGGRVLDVGCGSGHGTRLLAGHARQAVGVDISAVAVTEAMREHGDHAEFHQGDMCRLPFEDAEFDAIACFETISQTADVERALDELRRVLLPGGLLLISAPNRGVYPSGNPLHLTELTSRELEDALATRFANVAVHREQTYHATLLGTAATLAHDDPAVRIGADVTKIVGDSPGGELYAVAVASDGQLPPEPALVVLGKRIDLDEQRRLIELWQERCVRAEAEALALRNEVNVAQAHREAALVRAKTAERSGTSKQR